MDKVRSFYYCWIRSGAVMTVAGLWAVINNAGFNRQAPVELTSMDTFHHVADVMLFGTVLVTKAFLPLIRRAKGVRKKVDGAG